MERAVSGTPKHSSLRSEKRKYRSLQIVFHFANPVIAVENKNDSSYVMSLIEIFIPFIYSVLDNYFLALQFVNSNGIVTPLKQNLFVAFQKKYGEFNTGKIVSNPH